MLKSVLCLAFIFSGLYAEETTNLYFAYGSNLSYDFLKERLKNGPWTDYWHRSGVLVEPAPIDLGMYVLDDYEFGYTIDLVPLDDVGTAANIEPKQDSKVYGALYKISDAYLKELDETEDVPISYYRTMVTVHKLATQNLASGAHDDSCVKAWAYIGNKTYITQKIDPAPEYVELIVKAAKDRGLPNSYIEEYLEEPLLVPSR